MFHKVNSVATQLKCRVIFNSHFISNFPPNVPVKELTHGIYYCCCNIKSEVDALQQLCLHAGVGQKDINTCSPNKSRPINHLYYMFAS